MNKKLQPGIIKFKQIFNKQNVYVIKKQIKFIKKIYNYVLFVLYVYVDDDNFIIYVCIY